MDKRGETEVNGQELGFPRLARPLLLIASVPDVHALIKNHLHANAVLASGGFAT